MALAKTGDKMGRKRRKRAELPRREIEKIIASQDGCCIYCGSELNHNDCKIERSFSNEKNISETPFFEGLKKWRLERSRREGVPAYVVFSDKTLKDIVARLPMDREQLLNVHGIGQTKCDRYGEDVLQLVEDFKHTGESFQEEDFDAICLECDDSVKVTVRITAGQHNRLQEEGASIADIIRESVGNTLRGNPGSPGPVAGIDGSGPRWKRFRVIDDDGNVVDTYYKPG